MQLIKETMRRKRMRLLLAKLYAFNREKNRTAAEFSQMKNFFNEKRIFLKWKMKIFLRLKNEKLFLMKNEKWKFWYWKSAPEGVCGQFFNFVFEFFAVLPECKLLVALKKNWSECGRKGNFSPTLSNVASPNGTSLLDCDAVVVVGAAAKLCVEPIKLLLPDRESGRLLIHSSIVSVVSVDIFRCTLYGAGTGGSRSVSWAVVILIVGTVVVVISGGLASLAAAGGLPCLGGVPAGLRRVTPLDEGGRSAARGGVVRGAGDGTVAVTTAAGATEASRDWLRLPAELPSREPPPRFRRGEASRRILNPPSSSELDAEPFRPSRGVQPVCCRLA